MAAGNVGPVGNGETGLKQAAGVFALLACFAFCFGLQWFVGLCGAESGFCILLCGLADCGDVACFVLLYRGGINVC